MDRSVIAGIVGGIIAVIVTSFLHSKIRGVASNGELKYGWGMQLLGWGCMAFVALAVYAFFYDLDAREDPAEFYSIIGLFFGFGAGAIYSFGEYYKVKGKFDREGISFHTPWTGSKNEKWSNLEQVSFNTTASWYVLKFRSGKIIRIHSLLGGSGGLLVMLDELGYDL